MFSGEESTIPSYIAEIVESSQERLLLSTQNFPMQQLLMQSLTL